MASGLLKGELCFKTKQINPGILEYGWKVWMGSEFTWHWKHRNSVTLV